MIRDLCVVLTGSPHLTPAAPRGRRDEEMAALVITVLEWLGLWVGVSLVAGALIAVAGYRRNTLRRRAEESRRVEPLDGPPQD